jgi:Sugar kinases, ribokinase family
MTVLTLGETMALFDPVADGPPSVGMTYGLRFAGAESNFAIALARLGVAVRWVSRLGDDAVGDLIAGALRQEGIDVRWIARDPLAGTGAFMKIRDRGTTAVQYFRRGSAASHLVPMDLSEDALAGVVLGHLTGITLALGEGPRALAYRMAEQLHGGARLLTFDANYRPSLWTDPVAARRAQVPLLPFVDWYFCGVEEARALWGAGTLAALEQRIRSAGARQVVIRVGSEGAYVDGEVVAPPRIVAVRDEIGAGDAFDAGFVYALLRRNAPPECVRAGHVIAAHALRGTGDWETLPYLHDVRDQLAEALTVAPP